MVIEFPIKCVHIFIFWPQEKKNAIEVYLDDIFPNFSSFDDGLRMSHLTSIRTSLQPLLEAYADKDTQVRGVLYSSHRL